MLRARTSRMSATAKGLPTSVKIANRRRPGTSSRKSSSLLPAVSGCWLDRPVTLPPGRARLATMPLPTGSPAVANTIGIADVACFAARTAWSVMRRRITSTFSRTNSAAISAKRSLRPSPQRYSIATLRPSIQPSSRSRCTKAASIGSVPQRCQSQGTRWSAASLAAVHAPRAATLPRRRAA